VSGIWAGDATRLSASEAFPLLTHWETEHRSLFCGALASRKRRDRSAPAPPRGLLSFRQGVEALPRALADRLGDRLRREARVASIRRSGSGGWIAETAQGSFEAARLVLAAPAPDAGRLIAPLDPGASRELDRVPMPFLAVLHLAYPAGAFAEPLRGFGHLVAPAPGRRVLGAVWSSSLFPDRAPAGETLLTVFVGGSRDPEAAGRTDGELEEIASRELAADLGARRPPRLLRATRYARALPQYDFAHGALLSELLRAEAALPGLTFLGNYRGGVSVGDVVKSAQAEH
jgi:oxygen-dependent protoporphyrinogen oxidase